MLPQQYCLRWRYHHSNLQSMFSQLLEREAFCDVTLACEGKTIKAHKIVLSACSTYFETILSQYEEKDPILIMKDVKYVDIKCLVEFMYKGEINVDHCHLATLLKTAEELRIKGLAEVSWKDDDHSNHANHGDNATNNTSSNTNGGMPPSPTTTTAALSQVATVMDSPNSQTSPLSGTATTPNANATAALHNNNKRKRGRPPIDDYDQAFQQPKIMNVTGNADDNYNSNDAMSSSEHDLNIWEEESANEQENDEHDAPPRIKIKKEIKDEDDQSNQSFTLSESKMSTKSGHSMGAAAAAAAAGQSFLTPSLEKEWPDVIKMNDYLNTGRRQQFWEEPFTKRVMDAIKTKNLEMKVAAELLGVSYGTLYGRYRDSYGCLKHPYRVRDFWTEQGPTDVLLKLKRKEITLFRAAEQLNVTPQTLSNYLISMSQLDNPDVTLQAGGIGGALGGAAGHSYDESDGDEEDERERPPMSNNSSSMAGGGNVNLFKNLLNNSSNNSSNGGAGGATSAKNHSKNSVLANCPDITIIKKEKPDVVAKVNNNSDHSDGNSSDHGK